MRRQLPCFVRTVVLSFAFVSLVSAAEVADFATWPAGSSPKEIGQRVANRFLASRHPNFGRPTLPKSITYPEVCAWYGALNFAKVSGDEKMVGQLTERFEPLFREEKSMVP